MLAVNVDGVILPVSQSVLRPCRSRYLPLPVRSVVITGGVALPLRIVLRMSTS
jgi:hypothetical protein